MMRYFAADRVETGTQPIRIVLQKSGYGVSFHSRLEPSLTVLTQTSKMPSIPSVSFSPSKYVRR
jgi:hypothetical protein